MQKENLQFIVVNDPENDFDLMQEVYANNELLAVVRRSNGQWKVTFFSDTKSEISWKDFTTIHTVLSLFIAEMTAMGGEELRERHLLQ